MEAKNVAIVLSRYVCICDKQKERKRREGHQILLQVFHKQHNAANRFLLSFSFPLSLPHWPRYSAALDFCFCVGGLGLWLCHSHTKLNLCFPIMSIRRSCDNHVTRPYTMCVCVCSWCISSCFSSLCLRFNNDIPPVSCFQKSGQVTKEIFLFSAFCLPNIVCLPETRVNSGHTRKLHIEISVLDDRLSLFILLLNVIQEIEINI